MQFPLLQCEEEVGLNQKGSKESSVLVVAVLVLMAILLMIMPVLAGEGDGSGGGQGVPLGLASSTPTDGQTGVALQPEIKLTFNKNVINLAIRDANKNCFVLVSSAGSKVPIEVIMADDQIYPEEKRNVSLKPLQSLKPAATYFVKISPQLQAKNGTSLGHEVTVKFVTAGSAVVPPQPSPAPVPPARVEELPSDQQTSSEPDNKTANISDKSQTTTTEKNEMTKGNKIETKLKREPASSKQVEEHSTPLSQNQENSYAAYLIAAGLVLLAALGYVYFKKRNLK